MASAWTLFRVLLFGIGLGNFIVRLRMYHCTFLPTLQPVHNIYLLLLSRLALWVRFSVIWIYILNSNIKYQKSKIKYTTKIKIASCTCITLFYSRPRWIIIVTLQQICLLILGYSFSLRRLSRKKMLNASTTPQTPVEIAAAIMP